MGRAGAWQIGISEPSGVEKRIRALPGGNSTHSQEEAECAVSATSETGSQATCPKRLQFRGSDWRVDRLSAFVAGESLPGRTSKSAPARREAYIRSCTDVGTAHLARLHSDGGGRLCGRVASAPPASHRSVPTPYDGSKPARRRSPQ